MLCALGSWVGSTCTGGARRAVVPRGAAQWRSATAPVTRREPCVVRASLARPPPEPAAAPSAARTGRALNLSSTLSKAADSSAPARPGSEWPAPERPADGLSPWTVLRGAWQSRSFHDFMLHGGTYRRRGATVAISRPERAWSQAATNPAPASPADDCHHQARACLRPGSGFASFPALHANPGTCEPSTAT